MVMKTSVAMIAPAGDRLSWLSADVQAFGHSSPSGNPPVMM